jgi:3-(3-hydroxy-phenyl)propionate hydroxylase
MKKFRHGRVIFAGDAAHQVSPFGARGANSGIQDVDNLGWKLGLVLKGTAPECLLDSYDVERRHGADENILNSSRSTDFITPKSKISHVFRNAVLDLAQYHTFARPLVNSGRLSVPCIYDDLPLNTHDALPGGPARTRPGAPCPDAPLGQGFLLDHLGGDFVLLGVGCVVPEQIEVEGMTLRGLSVTANTEINDRYLGDATQAVYLIRPDQHVAARWHAFDENLVRVALASSIGKD